MPVLSLPRVLRERMVILDFPVRQDQLWVDLYPWLMFNCQCYPSLISGPSWYPSNTSPPPTTSYHRKVLPWQGRRTSEATPFSCTLHYYQYWWSSWLISGTSAKSCPFTRSCSTSRALRVLVTPLPGAAWTSTLRTPISTMVSQCMSEPWEINNLPIYIFLLLGNYWIDPNGGCINDAVKVFCNFSSDQVKTCITPSNKQVDIKAWSGSSIWFSALEGGFKVSCHCISLTQTSTPSIIVYRWVTVCPEVSLLSLELVRTLPDRRSPTNAAAPKPPSSSARRPTKRSRQQVSSTMAVRWVK